MSTARLDQYASTWAANSVNQTDQIESEPVSSPLVCMKNPDARIESDGPRSDDGFGFKQAYS